jgi:hypothetical protein
MKIILLIALSCVIMATAIRTKIPEPVSSYKQNEAYLWHGELTRDASDCPECHIPRSTYRIKGVRK